MNRSYHFPFVVVSKGVGTFHFEREGAEPKFTNAITGEQSDCRGVCITLEYFLAHNARVNPANNPEKDYYISEGYGPEPLRLSGCTSIDGALRYAELTSRNMFGRDESRGIVNRAVVHPYDCGDFKFDKEGNASFNDASIRNAVIGDSIIDPFHYDNNTEGDDTEPLLKYVDCALSDATCESFMREPFSRIAELEKQVAFLTGELQAATATIEKVREIMRSEPGYSIKDHARVLRMMADAFAKLQQ